ncbi:tyrosine-type recombinase/integrase [Ancrocorticia sp.]|uniref:tyrosine-type recombinase/integrase n=1 Tax=Ancrocorticia sp. TaxID=2593684 RepID=UPI003F91A6A7
MSPTPKKNPNLPRGITMNNGLYHLRLSYHGKQYSCGMYPTLKLAKIAMDKYRAEIILEKFVPPAERRRQLKKQREAAVAEKVTVGEWSTVWLESLEDGPHPRSPGTVTSYRSTLNAHILPVLATTALVNVTPELVNQCVELAKRSGEGASRNVARTLRAMFNAAVLAGVGGLKESPVKVKVEKAGTGRRADEDIPSLEEAEALADAMPADTRLAVELAVWLQLRVGEVLGLQRQDFKNLDKAGASELTIERQWLSKSKPPAYGAPKDDSYRKVAIPDVLAEKIHAHLKAHVLTAPESPVFPSSRDKTRPMSHNAFASRWNDARAKVRPGTNFHALRHLGLTLYAQAGATTTETMRRGGHKDIEAAQRYQHSSVKRDQELTARLNKMMKEN